MYTTDAMLAANYTPMVEDGRLGTNCLIKVQEYTISCANATKKVICVSQLTMVKTGEEVGDKLGDPVPFKQDAEAEKPATSKFSVSASIH